MNFNGIGYNLCIFLSKLVDKPCLSLFSDRYFVIQTIRLPFPAEKMASLRYVSTYSV